MTNDGSSGRSSAPEMTLSLKATTTGVFRELMTPDVRKFTGVSRPPSPVPGYTPPPPDGKVHICASAECGKTIDHPGLCFPCWSSASSTGKRIQFLNRRARRAAVARARRQS